MNSTSRRSRSRKPGLESLEDRRLLAGVGASYEAPVLLKDISASVTDGSNPYRLRVDDGVLTFTASGSLADEPIRQARWRVSPQTQDIELVPGGTTEPPTISSEPTAPEIAGMRFLGRAGGALYYARTQDGQDELRRTDENGGLIGQPFLLPRDYVIGEFEALGDSSEFAFTAGIWWPASGKTDQQLWRSDGTAQNTRVVATFPDRGMYGLTWLPSSNGGSLFFIADDQVHGSEIWRWNPRSADPPAILKDIVSSPGKSSSPAQLTAVGNALYFVADDQIHGAELWRSDGTEVGTRLVRDLNRRPAADVSAKGFQRSADGVKIQFTVEPGYGYAADAERWTTDGTAERTRRLTPEETIQAKAEEDRLATANATLNGARFYASSDPEHGEELWRSDGTTQGTFLLKDVFPGVGYYSGVAVTPQRQRYLQTLQGVNSGTPRGFTKLNDSTVIFRARTDAYTRLGRSEIHDSREDLGWALWKTDGTATGTVPLAPQVDVAMFDRTSEIGSVSNLQNGFTVVNDRLLFLGRDAATPDSPANRLISQPASGKITEEPWKLWSTDGTPEGTRPIQTFARENGDGIFVAINPMGIVGGKLYFELARWINSDKAAYEGSVLTHELWSTDGTAEGTHQVLDKSSFIGLSSIGALGDSAVFVAVPDSRLMISDGTAAGTRVLARAPGEFEYPERVRVNRQSFGLGDTNYAKEFVQIGGDLFFVWTDGRNGAEPWRTDGTSAGTKLAARIRSDSVGSSPMQLTAAGDQLFFTADDGVHGRELWRYDTRSGVATLTGDINPGTTSSDVKNLTAIGDQLIFTADNGTALGRNLWTTRPLKPATPPPVPDPTPVPRRNPLFDRLFAGSNYSLQTYAPVLRLFSSTSNVTLQRWKAKVQA